MSLSASAHSESYCAFYKSAGHISLRKTWNLVQSIRFACLCQLTIACSILLSMATTLAPEALQKKGEKKKEGVINKQLKATSADQLHPSVINKRNTLLLLETKRFQNRKENCFLVCYRAVVLFRRMFGAR